MPERRIALPTLVRLQEEPEVGGWSRFFDDALARIEVDEKAELPLREEIDR